MLLTKSLTIKTTNKNITYYQQFYPDIKSGDIITIKPEQLPLTSKIKVKVKCDVCEQIFEISYFSYLRNIEKYNFYSCKHCIKEKQKRTSKERFGVDSYTQTDDYVIKSKQTKKERYGDENYINIEKQRKTNREKYGVDSYMETKDFREKSKQKMVDILGVDHPLKSEIIKKQMEQNNIEKYGVPFVLQSEEIRNKIKKTKLENHGDENYNNRTQYKETCFERFGVDNPMQNVAVQNKLKNIIYEKYGVYYPAQSEEIYLKMIDNGYKIEKYKNTELYYQGSYEKDFLDRYYDIGIKRGPTIKYIYNGKEHFYFSDFYYEKLNLIIEIKSSKWFNEHKEKNLIKQRYSRKSGYNFLFIIDKDYITFENIIKHELYNKEHCWQFDIRLKTLEDDIKNLKLDINSVDIKDFEFSYIDSENKETCKEIKNFIQKYEWLGKMPNRPTHRFIAMYRGILAGVVIMSTPNSFSKVLGNDTKNMEKLISRGACASWTPKNLASKLIMWSIRWMVKNTNFRIFSAYSDTEAKEIGTIYQACNFYYLGQKYGSDNLYFDLNNPNIGWTTGRNFRKISNYKKIAKKNNIQWCNDWLDSYSILWDKMPIDVKNLLQSQSKEELENCLVRKTIKKGKYVYILGKNNTETKYLRKEFLQNNKIFPYPKR